MNKYVDDNVIRHIPGHLYKPEGAQKDVEIPTDEQVDDFIKRLTSGNNNEFNIIRNIAIVRLILGSGIRSEELINLDMKDLYLDEENPFIMVLGKGKLEQYDKVYISQMAKMSMKEYLEKREKFVKEKNISSNAVFLSNKNGRMSKAAITGFFNNYSDGLYPHMLRHWVGSKLYEQTKDIVLVQRQLRHSSLETSARYYVHMDEDVIANTMLKL